MKKAVVIILMLSAGRLAAQTVDCPGTLKMWAITYPWYAEHCYCVADDQYPVCNYGISNDNSLNYFNFRKFDPLGYDKGLPFYTRHYSDSFASWSEEARERWRSYLYRNKIAKEHGIAVWPDNPFYEYLKWFYRIMKSLSKSDKRPSGYFPSLGGEGEEAVEYQGRCVRFLRDSETSEETSKRIQKAKETARKYLKEASSNTNKELDCSTFIGKLYPELERNKMIEKIKDCEDTNCKCSEEAWPCRRLTQKQYQYLLNQGKIEKDITKIKPGSALYFEEDGTIVHAMFMEGRAKEKNKFGKEMELKCTKEYCPIITVSTSRDKPIKEYKIFGLTDGCYGYGKCQKYVKSHCVEYEKKQCLVGGGIP